MIISLVRGVKAGTGAYVMFCTGTVVNASNSAFRERRRPRRDRALHQNKELSGFAV